MVKELPAGHAAGSLQPDIRSVHAAVDGEARFAQALAEDGGILQVEVDQGANLWPTRVAVHRFGSALDDVADAVELRRVTAVPQRVQFNRFAIGRLGLQPLGHDREGTARPREARCFTEAAELDRHVARAVDLVDRMRDRGVGDVRFISGVEENNRVVGLRVIDELLERVPRRDRPRRVVGVAQIEQIDFARRQ